MRTTPFAFLRLGDRWVNLAMVTDIVDEGETLTVYLATDMARTLGSSRGTTAVDVARRFRVEDPESVTKLRKWLKLNDEE